jgi:pimeloyl-ACP methyl ester carboxylesterase
VLRRVGRLLVGNAAAAVDRAATLAAYAGSVRARKRSRAESLGHDARLEALAAIAELYPPEAAGYFREPRTISPSERSVRAIGPDVRVVDLAWASNEPTFVPDVLSRYGRFIENQVAAVRMFLHRQPRPVAVLVHGYLGGQFSLEQRVFPVEWLLRIGMDVALFVLPFHGVRADPARRGTPPFPGSDPRITNEGFRHAMADFRDLVGWLSARGHPSVGVMGMSLGGYTTALAATLEPRLSFAVPIIPLASLADFARDQGRLGRTPAETEAQHRALDAVHRVISPLARTPSIASERVLVIGARADQITPVSHARRLAHHFGARLESWPGGHLLQIGRADKFRKIGRLLDELGLTTRAAQRT